MKVNIFKIIVVVIMLSGSFSSCSEEETRKVEEKTLCNHQSLLQQYPWSAGNPPWVFEMISEWLENGLYGSITRCDYRDGRGYLFTPHELNDDFKYVFRNCLGEVLYEGKEDPRVSRPELNIIVRFDFVEFYPTWDSDQGGVSDEFLCYAINPITLPLVKELIYRCTFYSCEKRVSICTYRDGVGFLLEEHVNAGYNIGVDFLDCNGNLLCNISKEGNHPFNWCSELEIKIEKIILKLNVSLSFP